MERTRIPPGPEEAGGATATDGEVRAGPRPRAHGNTMISPVGHRAGCAMTERWPDLLVVGAPKGGTTSLHRYLDQHLSICMAGRKDTHFFADYRGEGYWDDPDELKRRSSRYLELFEGCADDQIRGEVSASYLWFEEAADRIRERCPDARIVVSLRNPIERAFSHWLHTVRDGSEHRGFLEAVEHELEGEGPYPHGARVVTKPGLYGRHVGRFLDAFGQDRVLVLIFERWTRRPEEGIRRILEFLGADVAGIEEMDLVPFNVHGEPRNEPARALLDSDVVRKVARALLPLRLRVFLGQNVLMERSKPEMDPTAVERLAELYDPQIEALERRLDRSLPELRTERVLE